MIHHLRMPPIRIRMLSRQLSRYVVVENGNHVKFRCESIVDHKCHQSYFRYYPGMDINARTNVDQTSLNICLCLQETEVFHTLSMTDYFR